MMILVPPGIVVACSNPFLRAILLAALGAGCNSSTYCDEPGCAGRDGAAVSDAVAGDSTTTPADGATDSATGHDAGESCATITLTGVIENWQDVLASTWPMGTSNIYDIAIPTPGHNDGLADPGDAYLAIRFDTADIVGHGSIVSIENTTASGVRLGSYSRCPGDFSPSSPCARSWGIGGSLTWSTEESPPGSACPLEPGTVYYLNLTYTDGSDPGSAGCTISPFCPTCKHCTTTLKHTYFN